MKVKLSICIPTYNRIEFLPGTIKSILDQYTPEMQIVISDNFSNDGTKELVQELITTHPECNIKYFCWDKNMGADLNYMKVIEIADGEYCWFLGSDDQIITGAVKKVITKLSLNYDTLLFCRINCDYYLIPIRTEYALKKGIHESTYNFSDKYELIRYLKNAQDLSALFSYLSTIIVKKSVWDNIPLVQSFIGSAYSHVYKILSILRKDGKLFYSSQRIVFLRMGNDSFETEKKIERFLLDINGYRDLGEYFFHNSEELKYYFWGVLRACFSWKWLYKARISAESKKDWIDMEKKLKDLFFSKTKLSIVNYTFPIAKLLLRMRNTSKNVNNTIIKKIKI